MKYVISHASYRTYPISLHFQNIQSITPMKKLFFAGLALMLTTSIYAQNIIIKDINIIPMTSNTVMANQSVLIKNGKIDKIGAYSSLAKDKRTTVINGKGKYLMPGLADMHVHLPVADKIEKLLLSNMAAGVTQIRIMNSEVPQTDVREMLSKNRQLISPKLHYSHLIKNTDRYTESQADSLMRQIKSDKLDFIKLLSLSDEQTFDNVTSAAKKYGVTICGHYPTFRKDGKSVMIDMEKAIKSNFKSIEHLGGYTALRDPLQLEKVIRLTKEFGTFNCPTLDWDIMVYNQQYPEAYKDRLTYKFLPSKVTVNWEADYAAAIEKAGGKEKAIALRDRYKASFDLKLKVLKKLYDNDCLLLVGSDPSSNFEADGFNVYEEMVNWSHAGIDNYTILRSATVNPSKFFNESNQWGTVEVGKNAELLILDKNPLIDIKNIATIETTIVGQKMFNNKSLVNQL